MIVAWVLPLGLRSTTSLTAAVGASSPRSYSGAAAPLVGLLRPQRRSVVPKFSDLRPMQQSDVVPTRGAVLWTRRYPSDAPHHADRPSRA